MADRVGIFDVEMQRKGSAGLRAFLTEEAHPLSRWYAIRALGRIGTDDKEAITVLGELLEQGGKDLPAVLWAAGTAQSEDLADAIAKHLRGKDLEVVAAAAEALGWTGKAGMGETLSPFLLAPSAKVRRAALMGIARLRPEGLLERVVEFTQDRDAGVRMAADFACWMLAGARKRAALAQDEKWDGDDALMSWWLGLLDESDPERRMAGIRPLGSLLRKQLVKAEGLEPLFALADDKDPRVVQDYVWRILTPREGSDVDAALATCLAHADPKVRQLAAEALGAHGGDANKAVLAKRFTVDGDPRIREVLAIELARLGDEGALQTLLADEARNVSVPAPLREMTHVRALAVSPREGALDELFALLEKQGAGFHAIAWMTVASELEGKEDERIAPWITKVLSATSPGIGDDPRGYRFSALLSLAAAQKAWPVFELTLKLVTAGNAAASDQEEVVMAVASAYGDLIKFEDCPPAMKRAMREWLDRMSVAPGSAWVRRAARKARGDDDLPEHDADKLAVNGWKGLPRPTKAILGLDLSEPQSEYLTNEETLRLADLLSGADARVEFKTSQGTFVVKLDAEEAPAHCVSLALAVTAGLYENTRWHRVVPNFVIQGGDPHGHGAGNGGWTVPDEITRRSYQRGALGMPKSQKDDGGCQLFFMHTAYVPLDGRYTCYGEVVSGMDTVDRIRVGDVIESARLITK
jgi:cyclophilin family peptidyl-prolyl cis-trans isomerase/HEAT repeat protein